MLPHISAERANKNLAMLFLATMGILAVSTLRNDIFYQIYPAQVYLVLHTLLEFASIIVSFSVFGVSWHSWKQGRSLRDMVVAATFLAVGMFDFGHTLAYEGMPDFFTPNSPDKAAVFWIFARLIAAGGLLLAAVVPTRKVRHWFPNANFIACTLICTLLIISYIIGDAGRFPQMYIWGVGSTHVKVNLEYLVMVLNMLAIFIYGYRNPSQTHTYYLRVALVLCLVSELAITFYTNVFDIYNLIGHFFKVAGYYYIMRALFETAILRPYARVSRLARFLRHLSKRNMTLYKEARESHAALQNAFIQLGTVIASKHDMHTVFSRIVQVTATVFNCRHVFLGMYEHSTDKIKVVSFVSSFQPPAHLVLEESFMGKVFLEKQACIIDDMEAYPGQMMPAIKRAGLRSMVGVPIIVQDEIIGVLELLSEKETAYSQEDVFFLKAFAQHVGEAINHARLYEHTVESYKQLSMQYEVVKSIALQTSPGALLKMVTERLYDVLNADGAVSFIMHHRGDGLHTEPVFVHNFPKAEVQHLQRLFSNDNAAWPWANSADDNMGEEQEEKAVTISVLIRKRMEILPLQTGGTLQGLIVFTWQDADARIPAGLGITLRTIAAQTAIALERAYLYENVKEMALTDTLTKLPNRRQLDISLTREMSRTRSFGRPMCLAMLDIDHFKKVNDNYGHLAGDEVLRQLGTLLKKHFRNTDIATRFGGEEFAVIMPETELDTAAAMVEAFREEVEHTEFDTGYACIWITISAGICIYARDSRFTSDHELIDAADHALYNAKQSGRNQVILYKDQHM